MNIFAGNFTLENAREAPDLDFDIIRISETSYFIMWGDEEISTESGLVAFLEQHFGKLISHNISLDTQWELEILMAETEGDAYESTTFSWPNTSFGDILERFVDSDEAICVREWKTSQYGNREVIVDFLY